MESHLVERQKQNPADAVIAHDLGLFHYWRAINQSRIQSNSQADPQKAVPHWEKAIANWAMVLENDSYWQDWASERGTVYKKKISPEDIAAARQSVREKLIPQLSHSHLEARFSLELNAIQLLKKYPPVEGQVLPIGPLQVSHLDLHSHAQKALRRIIGTQPETFPSSDVILAPLKKESSEILPGLNRTERRLQFYFSQLGTAFLYLERREPQRAIQALADVSCHSCGSLVGPDGHITPCASDCEHFPRLNPSYAFDPIGRERFLRHAVEISAGARLFSAHLLISQDPVPAEEITKLAGQALDISRSINIYDALAAETAGIILAWADQLMRTESWDPAIVLLEYTAQIETGERWKGKLAGALNVRGVNKANREDFQDALHDLRRAHKYNPVVALFRDNLEKVLHACANQAYRNGDIQLAHDLRDEAAGLGEELPPEPEPADVEETKEKEPVPMVVFEEKEIINPILFDQKGYLNLGAFDQSGRAVLDFAKEEAAALGLALLSLPPLVGALTRVPGGETVHLLNLQDIEPREFRERVQKDIRPSRGHEPITPDSRLHQFNLWHTTIHVLRLAWEIAAYDRGLVGEPHIMFGMLVNSHAAVFLKNSGVDVSRMLQFAGCY